MLLAIDTSLGSSVAAVSVAGDVLAERSSDSPRGHAEAIGALIEGVLADAALEPGNITAVVAGMGPGPFTGLRIGIAAARTFALGRGIAVLEVVSHDAIARVMLGAADTDRPATVVTDARRREVAVSRYRGIDGGIPIRVGEPQLAPAHPDREVSSAVSAGALGAVAAARRARGEALERSGPLYLRAPDAAANHAPKRVSA